MHSLEGNHLNVHVSHTVLCGKPPKGMGMVKKDYVWKVVDAILFVTVSSMLLVIAVQVVSRIAGKSVPWTEELSRYLFLWTVNFGMAVGMRHADHASVNFVYLVIPKKEIIKKIHLGIYTLSCVLFFSLLTYWNFSMTMRQLKSGEISPAMEIPMFLVTLPLFVCDILACIGLVYGVLFDEKVSKRIIDAGAEEVSDLLEEAMK